MPARGAVSILLVVAVGTLALPLASASSAALTVPATPATPAPQAPLPTQQSQLVDRIAAIVNREVITLGQLNRAVRLQETELSRNTDNCTPPAGAGASPEARMLQCMIDGLLMFQHVRRFPQFDIVAADIEAQYQSLVEQYGSRQAFEAELRRLQLTPGEVRYDLEGEALIANYINLRYRAVVEIGETAVRRYYEEVLRSEMERQRAELPLFEDVDDEFIRPILVETEVNRRVAEWIADLRRRADITVFLW